MPRFEFFNRFSAKAIFSKAELCTQNISISHTLASYMQFYAKNHLMIGVLKRQTQKRLKERKEISHILNLKVKPRARLSQNNMNAKNIWGLSSIFWFVQGMNEKIKNERDKFSAFQNQ